MDDLVVRAMLDPDVARLLYANVTARNQDSIRHAHGDRSMRVARVEAVVPQEDCPACRAALAELSNALVHAGRGRASTAHPDALLQVE